jgi:uncharacterized protein (DUF2336 family)
MRRATKEATTLASMQKQAEALRSLARDPSEPARAKLVSGLYDLSQESADVPAADRALASRIVLEIISRAATGVRRQLAERLAGDKHASKELALALARDEISVAFPVLLESEVLDDADLIDIVRQSPLEYRLGILQRETVSAKIAEVVVEDRDPHVMRWLLENPHAAIQRAQMETLVEIARAEPELQKPLIDRADLPTDLAARMYAFVPDELRRRIIERQRTLAQALDLRAAGALTVDLLLKTVRAGKMAEFESLFARFSRISLAAARQVLNSSSGEALAVVLRAQGVDKATFAAIFILTRKARDPGGELSGALARATDAFDRLSEQEAAKRLTALQAKHPEDPSA